jgi:Spy/CpxP family protein refolding chaperone
MKPHRAVPFALTLAAALSLGCKDESATPPVATATATATAAAAPSSAPNAARQAEPVKEAWRKRRRGSVAWSFLQAAHSVDLNEEQKAPLDKIAEQLHEGNVGARAEMKAYHAELVAQVRAGKVDAAKLAPLAAAVEKAQQARKEKDDAALDATWALLDAAQRKAVAARARVGGHDGDAMRRGGDAGKRRLDQLTKQLDLDAAQGKKVEAVLEKEPPADALRDEQEKRLEAVAAAFEGDAFDAKKLAAAAGAGEGLKRQAQFAGALLPVLKPEQREKLASSMDRPSPMWGGDREGADDGPREDAPPP